MASRKLIRLINYNMKTYIKKQYTGNENGWGEPIKNISQHTIREDQAEELNSHFRNTGIKYEEGILPTDDAPEDKSPIDKQKDIAKSNKKVDKLKKDAKPSETTFVKSDQHIEDAIDQDNADKVEGQ